jgi:Mg-chelatase subunit ChlD
MLVGMGGVGVSVASAEEDATAVDTSAVIEPQAGQQEVEPAETASESQTKQQDEDQAERPDEEQTKQQTEPETEPNGVASEQGDAAKSNDDASEQDDADSIQSITQPDDQPIALAAQPTALANQIQPAAESETGSQLLEETFKNSNFADPDSWSTKDGACLTAKTGGCTSKKDSTAIQGHEGKGYLQLTDNSESAKGSVLYNQPIISKNGLHVSFDYYMYYSQRIGSGLPTPGDGIGFFLVDGAATLQQTGAAGAGLGYATNDEDGTDSKAREEGVAQGILGIGLDRFGNFSTQHASGTKNRVTGGDDCGKWNSSTGSNSITLRGKGLMDDSGKWTKGYCIVTSKKVSSLGTGDATNSATDANGKRVDITIAPLTNATATTQRLTVKIGSATVLEHDIDRLPDSVKFGFSASTGAAHQVQLIRGLSVYSMKKLSQLDLVKSVDKDKYPNADTHVFQVGDKVPYKFVVRNSGNTQLNNITVNDPNIANVACDARTLAPGAQTQCSGTLTITESLVGENGTFTNTATATATDADGKSVTSPQAQATIHVNKPLGAPEKHKRIKKNDDGSYTVNVDVKGAASSTTVTTTQPIDFTLVLDVSGSMDDSMGSNDSTKRLAALKTAVDNFLDGAAAANEGSQSGSEPVRVGLVKFSGEESKYVGNDMYSSGGYRYNYSQIVSNLTADMSGLRTKVKELEAAGSTRADNGFKRAVKVMENARSNAKKVVIFFTDGKPTSASDFDASVANGAVTAAKTLKDQGDTVYSIGIFSGANPSSTKGNANQFMHAVSSNFPKATSYDNRGDGDKDAGYYKAATNASELNAIFDEIEKSETTTSAYTKVTMEDTLSGYVELADSNYKVVAKDASGKVVSLTKNVDYTLTYDASTKKFTVAFLKPLVNNVIYTLEYNVKPTQKAYDEYAANLNAGKDGYDGVKGNANTDLPGNATSSNQPGFHTNDSACLSYTADGVDHACGGNPYPHPVIQVVSSTLHIEKQWSGDGDKPESITVDIKQGGNSYKTVTLKPDANGNWSTDVIIPAGAAKTYTVTETEPENHQWQASYQHKVGNGALADGNVVTVPESTASQNATVVITNTLKTATLKNAIGVKKELVGRDWKDSDEFTFKLKADDSNPDAPMPASCKNQSACTVTVKRDSSDDHVAYFGDITYDAGEAEYTYLVTENAGNASAMYYSQAEYRVVVSVMKDGTSGEWKAVVESVTQLKTDYGAAGSNWDETQPMLFTNQYISASSLPLTGRMGAERWWQIAAGGVGVLALLAVAAADQWRRKKRLS